MRCVPFFFRGLDYIVIVKNTFLSFLALLMFVPSLACAMPMCTDGIKENSAAVKPCGEHHVDERSKKSHIGDFRFVLDCMGVDLQKADTTHFEKAGLRTALVDLPFIDNVVASQNTDYSPQIIRGPPPDWSVVHQSHASIILNTQRLRL